MHFPWKLMLFVLCLGFHCSGAAHNRHEIEKRETKEASKEWRFPSDFLKTILSPITYLAEKLEEKLPGLGGNSNSD